MAAEPSCRRTASITAVVDTECLVLGARFSRRPSLRRLICSAPAPPFLARARQRQVVYLVLGRTFAFATCSHVSTDKQPCDDSRPPPVAAKHIFMELIQGMTLSANDYEFASGDSEQNILGTSARPVVLLPACSLALQRHCLQSKKRGGKHTRR